MRLKLVPGNPVYAEAYFAWRQEPLTKLYNPLKQMSLEECRDSLAVEGSDLSYLPEFPRFRWFMEVEGSIAGNVSLNNVNLSMQTAEIGYGVMERFHGKGLATLAVRLIVDKVFLETGIRKLIAYVHDQNLASCRVLEKTGFRQEGLLRSHYLINGKPENEFIYGLLRGEWECCRVQ